MKKLPWVKWEASAFLAGVAGLTANEIVVYTIVLNLIYDRGGPITDDVGRIARRCGLRPGTCDEVLTSLVSTEKIVREGGSISNLRAEKELATREKVHAAWKDNFTGDCSNKTDKSNKNNEGKLPLGTSRGTRKRAVEEESVEKKERKKDSTSPKRATLNGVDYSEEFEAKVWQPYPRKKGTSKHKAYQLWNMLNDANQQRVIAAIPLFAAEMKGREDSVIRHLERFISQRVYETYAAVSTESNVVPLEWHKTATRDQWTRALKIYEMDSNWRSAWGPKPGQDGCTVPQDLIDALPYHLHPDRDRPRGAAKT